MDIASALQIVIDLAKQAEEKTNEQQEAIIIVEDMAVNQFGDD